MANHGKGGIYRRRRVLIELAVIAGGALFLLLLLTLFGLHETIDEAVGNWNIYDLHLDEFLLLFIYLGIAFAVFSVRRQRELDREINAHLGLESSLRESDEKFRALADSTINGMVSIDSRGRIVFWNRAATTIFGYKQKEILGKDLTTLMPERYRTAHKKSLRRIVEKGEPTLVGGIEEIVALKKGGAEFPIELSLSQWNHHGQKYFTALVRDISQRKAHEEKLAFSEERYRAIVEYTPYAVVLYDKNGIMFANPAAVKLLGASTEEELLGRPPLEFVHPESQAVVKERMRKQKQTLEPVPPLEEKFLRLDGSSVDVEVAAIPIMYQGRPVMQVIAQDITKRKAASEKLKRSEQRHRMLVESARDIIFTIDLETATLSSLNPAFGLHTGWKAEDWVGKPFSLLIYPDDLQKAIDVIDQLAAGRTTDKFELRILIKAGGFIIMEFNIKALTGDGKVTGILGIARDVSERKRTEEQLELQRRELMERTEELDALYRVSSIINQNLRLADLLDRTLNTLAGLEILKLQRTGGILLVKGENMELAAYLGHADAFLREHEHLTIYDCLCGLAARTGEMVVSDDSGTDVRHTIHYPGMKPHGHVIVPLKAFDKVVGVMYFYLPVNAQLMERQKHVLDAIGDQLGIAIANVQLYEETEKQSLHDALTGLANRNLMNIVLGKCMARAKRSDETYSLIMLDLDHFKHYNDTHGHTAGDRLLAGIGGIIAREVREVDTPVRFGGEEFLVILPGTGSSAAAEVAERIRSAVMNTNSGEEGNPPRHVTISAGVAEWQKGKLSTDEMISLADNALYEAKRRGRNRVITSVRA